MKAYHLKQIVLRNGDPIPFDDMWKKSDGAPLWMQAWMANPGGELLVVYLSPYPWGSST